MLTSGEGEPACICAFSNPLAAGVTYTDLFTCERDVRVVYRVLCDHVKDARILFGRASQGGETRWYIIKQVFDLFLKVSLHPHSQCDTLDNTNCDRSSVVARAWLRLSG